MLLLLLSLLLVGKATITACVRVCVCVRETNFVVGWWVGEERVD